MRKREGKRINVSIEARMTSTRLPGKVLMPAAGLPLLEIQILRCRKAKLIDDVIVATTTNATDDPIIELCERLGAPFHRGSEPDVLQRVLDTHRKHKTDIIVELTGDNPLQDPTLIDECVDFYLKTDFDYVCNGNPAKRRYPVGQAVQVFSLDALEIANKKSRDAADREHVSYYLYDSGEFKVHYVEPGDPSLVWPEMAFTVDTKPEYLFVKKVAESFPDLNFSLSDMLTLLRSNPELRIQK